MEFKHFRSQFKIFENHKGLVYFDNAASTQKPHYVLKKYLDFYENSYANIHRGIYDLSERATELYEGARGEVSRFLGIESKHSKQVIFTSGSTEGINTVANSLSRTFNPEDEVLILSSEHHANIVPWLLRQRERPFIIKYIKCKNNGDIDFDHLEQLLSTKTRLICFSAISNVFGIMQEIEQVIRLKNEISPQAEILVDGAQLIPHTCDFYSKYSIDDIDYLVFSGHKVMSPTGTGALVVSPSSMKNLTPLKGGGDMIEDVDFYTLVLAEAPQRFEAGTTNFAGTYAMGVAMSFLKQEVLLSTEFDFKKHLEQLTHTLFGGLKALETQGKLRTIGDESNIGRRAGLVTFEPLTVHPHDLADKLNKKNICVRAGLHCAHPIHKEMGVNSSVRASLYFYNTSYEVELLLSELEKLL
jgi:cysteine desulfurase/selenocysteine lyase